MNVKKNEQVENLPVTVESDGSVREDSKDQTDGRARMAVDTQEAALLRVLATRAGHHDEVARSSGMHRLQFHRLK